MTVMIGVDPHQGSHTAVAIGPAEEPLGRLRVGACGAQAHKLLAWAAAWPERTWAVEGAGGLGHLLAQQLVAAGERVLDVPPKLAASQPLLARDYGAGTRADWPIVSQDSGTRPVAASSSSRRSCSTLRRISSSVPRPYSTILGSMLRANSAQRR